MVTAITSAIRIGFPRAMLYHKYGTLWTHFFRELGCQIVISPQSNRVILEEGARYSIDEACLSVKMFMGHVAALIGKVDYVFLPRIASRFKDEQNCYKLFALADNIRSIFGDLPLLEYTVDVRHRQYEFVGMYRIGRQLGHSPLRIMRAYLAAQQAFHHEKTEHLHKQQQAIQPVEQRPLRVLLAGHTYVNYDAMLGKRVADILEELDVEILYSDLVEPERARLLSARLSTDLYWSYSKEILGAIEVYKHDIDGIIFLMAFPCGPDALVIDLCKNRITDLPVAVIILDELQSDAGLKTRLESFVDILGMRS